ncbi:MAG: SNARE associated Golgi protein [Candidatus Omnitrophica bacterium ADurb.Bin277]|nr:MAG: SNARE associated Golgi protein [Candidatus Omnitrophica bacterium ADurb.Bin277]
MKIFRKLYDWGLKQAESPHAERALFWVAFVESSFFPLPPDVLLIAMVLSARAKWLRYFYICLAGSVLGGLAGYGIGFGAWQMVQGWFFAHVFPEAAFIKVQELYRHHDFWVIFAAGFTPIPYKIFTLAAGVASIDLVRFFLASVVGRGARFILVTGLLYLFGPRMRIFIEKYFNWVTIAFFVLLAGGFYFIKYFLR